MSWLLSTSPDLDRPVARGDALASGEHDHTVKVDACGLEPSTTYYFGFECAGRWSPVGRTRTAPAGATPGARLGVVSCASWSEGFFNAYARLADREVDLVVHLGDYVYEDGRATKLPGRAHRPAHRLRSLADYRARHAQYRTDPDLQRLHRRHPMVAVWDDHDIAGNAWRDGAAEHDPGEDGPWPERRAAAVQAYLEWVPVRSPDPGRPDRVYRSLSLGDLAELVMLDTRIAGRERPAKAGRRPVAAVDEEQRSLLGDEQWAWLREVVASSRRRWRLLGSQVVMSPLRALDLPAPLRRFLGGLVAGGAGVNTDQWDGYPAERRSLFELLGAEGASDTVVLSGDLHSSWAGELTLDPGAPGTAAGVEFVTPSVTAPSFASTVAPPVPFGRALLDRLVARQNPHMRYFDLERHGYLLLDVTPEVVQAEWWHVDTVVQRLHRERLGARWQVRRGTSRLEPATDASPPVRWS